MRADRRFGRGGIEVVVVLRHVRQHRSAARLQHSCGGRRERVRGQHDLVVRLEPGREQREAQRVGAVGDADAVGASAVGGEPALERRDLWAVRECGRVDQIRELREDPRLQPVVCGSEIDERNRGVDSLGLANGHAGDAIAASERRLSAERRGRAGAN